MPIHITSLQIDTALPKIKIGLQQYLDLQFRVTNLESFVGDADFRKRFNHFYRVRRGVAWQEVFYNLMTRAKRENLQFDEVLELLHEATGRYEASFASKLIATLQTSKPVIDSVVLRAIGLRLPVRNEPHRGTKICEVYRELESLFEIYLATDKGANLIKKFDRIYPNTKITNEKKLDLVLWKNRS